MRKTIIFLTCILFLAGCAGKQRSILYYTIDSYSLTPPDTVQIPLKEPLPYIVEVIDFAIAGPYNDARIALRTDSNELEYYHYHQWAETPGNAVRYFVWTILHGAGIFEVCQLRLTVTAPQLIVTGAINKLERVDIDGEAGARVQGVIELVDVRNNRIILSHRFDAFSPFENHTPMNVFANEINNLFSNEMYTFMKKTIAYFRPE
jgi:ABC-type uncharacterized transport system auxiliary subunit